MAYGRLEMLACIITAAVLGLDGRLVAVPVDIGHHGVPNFFPATRLAPSHGARALATVGRQPHVSLEVSRRQRAVGCIMMRCYDDEHMRTTINLDDDVLETTRAIARAERRALGAVVSDLVRRGLVPSQPRIDQEEGFPVFRVRQPAQPITDEMVRAALEEA